MRKAILAAASAFGLLAASGAAQAVSYDVAADYGSANFSYGYGSYDVGGSLLGFTPYSASFSGGCYGDASFACMTTGAQGSEPFVGKDTAATTTHFLTVDVPTGLLAMHPGSALAGQDSIVEFTAPTAGTYSVTGSFSRLDEVTSGSNDPGNNGVFGVVYRTVGGLAVPIFTTTTLNGYGIAQGASEAFTLSGITLGAGDMISFAVANNGVYYNDSTGLTATIDTSAVPEPATWATMIAGIGGIGATLRRRRAKPALA